MSTIKYLVLASLFLSGCSSEQLQANPNSNLTETWQWDLSDEIDLNVQVDMIDLDYETDPEIVAHFNQQGTLTTCYISVGSWEEYRPDADQFPPNLLGNDYEGWPGEKWLDIREIERLAPIMQARFDLCAASGFNAIEPDNMDVFTNQTGFPITYADQLVYAEWLANEAHQRGLQIALKNNSTHVTDLVDLYDFVITEDCVYYDFCEDFLPFIEQEKRVYVAEYTDLTTDFDAACNKANQLGLTLILKHRDLDSWVSDCP